MAGQMEFVAPLYQQVRENIKAKIVQGEWGVGSVIPGDSELSRQLGVSVGTVRKALDELARQRLVVRERGRGTFINRPTIWATEASFGLHGANGTLVSPSISILQIDTVPATEQEILAFNLKVRRRKETLIHRIFRQWKGDGRTICADRITLDPIALQRLPQGAELLSPALDQLCADQCIMGHSHSEYSFQLKRQETIDAILRNCFPQDADGCLVSCLRTVFTSTEKVALISKQLVDLSSVAYRLGAEAVAERNFEGVRPRP